MGRMTLTASSSTRNDLHHKRREEVAVAKVGKRGRRKKEKGKEKKNIELLYTSTHVVISNNSLFNN